MKLWSTWCLRRALKNRAVLLTHPPPRQCWRKYQPKAYSRDAENETDMGILGPSQNAESQKYLPGLVFQLGCEEEDDRLSPALSWGKSQPKACSTQGGNETDMGFLGPSKVAEGQQYLSVLVFQLGREEEDGCLSPGGLQWSSKN